MIYRMRGRPFMHGRAAHCKRCATQAEYSTKQQNYLKAGNASLHTLLPQHFELRIRENPETAAKSLQQKVRTQVLSVCFYATCWHAAYPPQPCVLAIKSEYLGNIGAGDNRFPPECRQPIVRPASSLHRPPGTSKHGGCLPNGITHPPRLRAFVPVRFNLAGHTFRIDQLNFRRKRIRAGAINGAPL